MRTKAIAVVATAALLAGWTGAANAASVSFTPDVATTTIGQTVTFTYEMDFSDDSTLGGGTDFWYDNSVLQFIGWSFDAGLSTDNPFFRRDPTDCSVANSDAGCGFDANEYGPGLAQLNGMAFGQDGGTGMSGPAVIGQAVFQAVGLGTAQIFMAANDDGVAGNPGPFVSGNSFTIQQVDMFGGAVSVSQVPIPAAAWLMLSGIGFLGGLRRRA